MFQSIQSILDCEDFFGQGILGILGQGLIFTRLSTLKAPPPQTHPQSSQDHPHHSGGSHLAQQVKGGDG